jgi:hypothetical protein
MTGNMIDILAENEKLRAQVQELLPWAVSNASALVSGRQPWDSETERVRSAAKLLIRVELGEFDV